MADPVPFDLDALLALAEQAGESQVLKSARALAERVRDGLFYVACLGQFKRGKSSLLNALVGTPVLPVGVVPVTAVITVLRYGERPAARVRLEDGAHREIALADVAEYVSEEKNHENCKRVAAVEVFLPCGLLRSGMCLVDTPGIGSVFEGNTAATKAFVPHVDAAIVVLGADPPISGEELDLVSQVLEHVSDLFFVLAKADKMTERERDEAVAFTRRILQERLGLSEARVFTVSAHERLRGEGATRDWAALTASLERLAHDSGASLVRSAAMRGVSALRERLAGTLKERLDTFRRPVEESERRIETLRRFVAEAERSLEDLSYLFMAEEDRLARTFAKMKENFLRQTEANARAEFAAAVQALPARNGSALREEAIRIAHEVAKRHLDAFAAEMGPAGERLYVEATNRFVELANDFLRKLRESAGPLLATLPSEVVPEAGYRARSHLYYASLMSYTSRGPAAWFLDLIRSRSSLQRAVLDEIGEYLQTLLFANASRIEADHLERVRESRRRFLAEVRGALEDVVRAAQTALDLVREAHRIGRTSVESEITRLESLLETLSPPAPEPTAPAWTG